MGIANDTLVLVTDGRKMLFLRNAGDREHMNLEVEKKAARDDLPDRELSTDEPGSVFMSGSPGRSSYEETDFHQLEEDRWAHEAADRINARALDNDFDDLVIIAPPKTLGELRKKLHKETQARLRLEIDKEMTNQPLAEIEKLIAEQTKVEGPPEVLT
ncbi:host attachment family protein [Sphingomicrobium astaxanthinifaciens]|uniref:host attachment family protein n=1 Tax=Sphingomicrobium astaxanthinifaciens TaxID=1227949 RepID=UPI001FCA91AD|nr:host attachment family protein [Sphingomicrobium astaxanthinifaciens]MCJ7422342.1 host attachment family protein [Sphingomicrobium astaxanthinifaciens]